MSESQWLFVVLAFVAAAAAYVLGKWRERSRDEDALQRAAAEVAAWRLLQQGAVWQADATRALTSWQAPPGEARPPPDGAMLAAVLASERPFRDLRLPAIDGSAPAWQIDGEPLRDGRGRCVGFRGCARPAREGRDDSPARDVLVDVVAAWPGPALLAAGSAGHRQVLQFNDAARAHWPRLLPGADFEPLAASLPARAQTPPAAIERPAATAPDANPVSNPMAVPGFWDPRRRPERPDLSRIGGIRFLTETDYPPFDYAGPDGAPAGFNVDLARLICEEIKVACTVQMRRFDTLVDTLNGNGGDAVIASIAATPDMRKRVDFSDPYYRTPARFVARRDFAGDVRPEALEGKKIGVVGGTAHEAYIKALFTEAALQPFPNTEAARAALKKGEIDLLFGDGISLAFWLNGTESANCCEFRGGPYMESRYFGEGIGIAVRRGNDLLRQAFNWALFRLWEKGRFTDLWLRYFPISPF